MRGMRSLVATGLALALSGCIVVSVNPPYEAGGKELTFDAALLGAWQSEDGKCTYTFAKAEKPGDEKAYDLVMTREDDQEEPIRFDVHLVQLGHALFADLCPPESPLTQAYGAYLIRTHSFFRLWVKEDVLELGVLGSDAFCKMVEAKKCDLPYGLLGGHTEDVLLVASTKDIQAFLLKYADDKEVFSPVKLPRKK